MKTAISLPDPLFEQAEQFALRKGVSRSELYAIALKEYLQAHRYEGVTERLDTVYGEEDSSLDPFLVRLQANSIGAERW
jgi:metal-responsive CopG/Arc/MetJ family transcriptional regulator